MLLPMRRIMTLLFACVCLALPAQIHRDSTTIQIMSRLSDSIPGNNIISRHLNWVQGSVLNAFLDNPDKSIPNDTNYMVKPTEKLRIGTSFNVSGANMTLKGKISGEYPFSMPLNSQAKTTMGLSLCYRGLSMGFSFSPLHLGGKNHDTDICLSAYNERFGGDIIYHSSETFSGKFSLTDIYDEEFDIPKGSIRQNIYCLNGYYSFNWKRFALPAVFDRSWIQKRSAGSVLLGCTMMCVDIEKLIEADGTDHLVFRLYYPAIGGGYGYNWVCAHHWLIHADALFEIVPYVFGYATISEEKKHFPYKWPPVMVVSRFGALHYFHRYYAGINIKFNDITVGQEDRLQLKTSKWDLSLFLGIRI